MGYSETIDSNEVNYILDYVEPEHRYITSAMLHENYLSCLVRFVEPDYMKPPVDYLNSSVLISTVAQCAHVLVHSLLKLKRINELQYITIDHLAELRQSHNLFFSKVKFRFLRTMTAHDYNVDLHLRSSRRSSDNVFLWIDFEVPTYVKGSIVCAVPMMEKKH